MLLNLSPEINSLKKRIAEAKELKLEFETSPSFEFDEGLQAGALVQEERIERLTEMLDFCYNLLSD